MCEALECNWARRQVVWCICRLTGLQLAASLNGTHQTPLSTHSQEATLGSWPSRHSCNKKKPNMRLASKKEMIKSGYKKNPQRHWTETVLGERSVVYRHMCVWALRCGANGKMLKECLKPSFKHGGEMLWLKVALVLVKGIFVAI